ncbi:biotin--[acetyl-CoA-carboxylase] ligase [Croceicoccus ponticola]|uniref:biotin--[biotin carboxyl-carrier protein] ligase n=1 Tax=Croceicoccus ponticola TaxID=2217664 RepID=A0A437H0I8_9SPHN|nr:biotin--[acetyl-CoA-carboxylase] ligase [Croceicoccus ponticola]RVQ69053.1 biotin--[acetyl-CoA-carboxylase] ligase [Croceicoccus ponticola]
MTGETSIEYVDSVGSTNAELSARLRSARPPHERAWLVANRQDAGRGRLGREWHDGAGNFMGSTVVVIRPDDPMPQTLALVAGIAVHEAVSASLAGSEGHDRLGLFLKWPNDVLLGGAKLAGILLEKFDDTVIVGIGVNLAQAPDLPDRATVALADHGVTVLRDRFAENLAATFAKNLAAWRNLGLNHIIAAWTARGPAIGIPVRVALSDAETLHGYHAGLNPDGALRIRLEDGTVRAIYAGEVALLGGELGD